MQKITFNNLPGHQPNPCHNRENGLGIKRSHEELEAKHIVVSLAVKEVCRG